MLSMTIGAAGRAVHQQVLSRLQVAEETLKENLESACALLSRSHAQYLAADHLNRRDLNQAVFERIYILDDEVVGCDFTPAFNKLLNEDLEADLKKESTEQTRPIKALWLVEERPEPRPAMQSESGHWVPRHGRTISHARRTGRERPHGVLSWESKNPRPHKEAEGSNVNLLVGLPVSWFRTSWSQVSRHPGLMSRVIPE
jgi:site-specific DNA recombinase